MTDITTAPDLSGKIALVTGATSGIGLETAALFGIAGAETILGVRDETKARRVITRLRREHPEAAFRTERLDLTDLGSVADCAARLIDQGRPLDILVNNAGVMTGSRQHQTTNDGFELHLGTNFLGPFALTAGLLPALRRSYAPRVTCVTSLMAFRGRLDLDKPMRYTPVRAYARSKLALATFGVELQRRSDAGGWGLTSTLAHPGWARTALGNGAFTRFGPSTPLLADAAVAARNILVAATSPEVHGGDQVGPSGRWQLTGHPGLVRLPRQAEDAATAARLWEAAAGLTGAEWPDA